MFRYRPVRSHLACDTSPGGLGHCSGSVPRCHSFMVHRPRPAPDRSPCLSRLIFRPFRLQPPHCHFVTVALTRYFTAVTCRVYPTGQTSRVGGNAVARSRVRQLPAGSPTGLAESSSLVLRTGLVSSGCSPPCLAATQLPLSDTGR
jgi:hypothetical protein